MVFEKAILIRKEINLNILNNLGGEQMVSGKLHTKTAEVNFLRLCIMGKGYLHLKILEKNFIVRILLFY